MLPFTGALSFPAMVLRPELPWQREMLDIMETMRKAFFEKRHADPGSRAHFEYWMALCITGLWYRLISHVAVSYTHLIDMYKEDAPSMKISGCMIMVPLLLRVLMIK